MFHPKNLARKIHCYTIGVDKQYDWVQVQYDTLMQSKIEKVLRDLAQRISRSIWFGPGSTLSLLLAGVGTTLFDATLLVPAYNTGLMRPFETKNLGKVFA